MVNNVPELPPHYYRDNFLQLLDTVDDQYRDILLGEELDFLSCYRGLPFEAQCLYVRLVSRVGPWFREARLEYPELGELGASLTALLNAGLMLQADSLSTEEIGRLCTRDELAGMFSLGTVSKRDLLQQISEREPEGLPLLLAFDGQRVIAPAHTQIVQLMQVLFFGNRHQGLTDFVLSDLGVARYFPYQLDRTHRLFPGRNELEEYVFCAQRTDQWQVLREEGDALSMLALADELLAEPPRYATTERRWFRLCNSLARQLEREKQSDKALALYAVSQLHPARERRARLLEGAGEFQEALSLCGVIENAPWCEDERDAALRIAPRLKRKLHGTKVPRPRHSFAESELHLPQSDLCVELKVAEALSDESRTVHYVENQLMNALFGLFFWEQIFSPVSGAFNNRFQSAPADMYDRSFYFSRQEQIDARLNEAKTLDLAEELQRCWHQYRGYQCRWINWKYLDKALVAAAGTVIPKQHLMAIWQRMLFDPGENRRGFPDLLALGTEPGDYQMIEVKGPGDTLQDSQKRWLNFFQREGIPASVLWVHWTDD
ncbi:MAG: VRR-NUC domain-containing protein [Halioglobus sp.]